MNIISSNQNNTVKKLRLLKTKKGRERFSEFLVEGNKFALDIPESWEIMHTFLSESYYNQTDYEVISKIKDPIVLTDNIFNSISDTMTPSGILSVVKLKCSTIDDVVSNTPQFIVVAVGIQDPGNLGTIIRTADASGVNGIIVSKDCADIFSPKVVRATAGSLFNIPIIVEDTRTALTILSENGIKLIATDLKAEKYIYEFDFSQSIAVIIGNESKGLEYFIMELADLKLKLPMIGKAESLNVAVAGGIIMYEVLRQRIYYN